MGLIVTLLPVLLLALPESAAGHITGSAKPPELRDAWTYDPLLLLTLGCASLLYGIGLKKYWRRAGVNRGVRIVNVVSFTGGMLTLFLALVWPLDAFGEWSLAAHMGQHMLLIAVAPPLLILGRPGLVWLAATPDHWKQAVTLPFRLARQRNLMTGVAGTTAATLSQAGVMWAWHIPAAMQRALLSDPMHYAMHASFFGAGLLFWWALFLSLREHRAGFGAGVIALVGTMVQMGFLSALLTFSLLPRYPFYSTRTGMLGLTPLEDQQLAGLIMWVPGAVPYLIGVLLLMAVWLRDSERRDLRRARSAR